MGFYFIIGCFLIVSCSEWYVWVFVYYIGLFFVVFGNVYIYYGVIYGCYIKVDCIKFV